MFLMKCILNLANGEYMNYKYDVNKNKIELEFFKKSYR